MTREEAIDRLKEAKAGHKEFLSVETLNMAIKALEQETHDNVVNISEDKYIYETKTVEWKDAEGNIKSHIVNYKTCPLCGTVKESTFIRNRS